MFRSACADMHARMLMGTCTCILCMLGSILGSLCPNRHVCMCPYFDHEFTCCGYLLLSLHWRLKVQACRQRLVEDRSIKGGVVQQWLSGVEHLILEGLWS